MLRLLILLSCIFFLPSILFAEESRRPINISILQVPIPVPADKDNYLVYELQIVNNTNKDLRLGLIDINDQAGNPLKSYSGNALKQNIIFYDEKGPYQIDSAILKKGMGAFAFVTIAIPKSEKIPSNLQNRIFFVDANKETGLVSVDSVAYVIYVGSGKPLVLDPPLRGANWIAAGGLSSHSYHRRSILYIDEQFYLAQRYAVDWEQICDDGQSFHNSFYENKNWNAHGQYVLAGAEGVVVKVQNGLSDNTPSNSPKIPLKIQDVPGNYVTLKVNQNGRDYYVHYAHLLTDSIQVHEGDRVKKDQIIALVGNSGNSSVPHLHFHVTDVNDPLKSEGVPFVFESVNLAGNAKLIDAENGIWKPLILKNQDVSKNVAPLEDQLFDFSIEKRFKCP